VVFGAYALGGGYWGPIREPGGPADLEAVRAVHAALDAGMNAFDTAPVYGFGHSEELLGRALAGRRDAALVMTKVGLRWEDLRGLDDLRMPDRDGTPRRVERDSRPASVRAEVERSLARLGMEHLDLVQVHARDPRTPIDETMGALADLRRAGLVRAIGVSNFTAEELEQARRALGEVPLASDQPQYSLLARGIERDVLPWARRSGVGLLVYSPLAQGLLSGKATAERRFDPAEGRARKPDFALANRARVNALLERVVAPIAARHGASVAQAVIAWTVDEPGVTAALVGARTAAQARENAAAGALVLSPGERAAIGEAFRGVVLERPKASLAARVRSRVRRWLG
jgi:aryl-alcohol dehydrogenase-like predicted oxidoreductase